MSISETIQQNLAEVQRRIAAATDRVGRSAESVQLIAVTKYADWEWVQALSRLHRQFGENRPQQLAERQPDLPEAEWHLIGQLQRNKVRLALPHAAVIHSVDSVKLLRRIADIAQELQQRPRVLLQVNISGEDSKSGFAAADLRQAWPEVCQLGSQVEVAGLMTLAPAVEDPEQARPVFHGLRLLRDELAARPDSQSSGITLPELSMGMSEDFEVAIQEGATMIRIGSRLFQGLADPTAP